MHRSRSARLRRALTWAPLALTCAAAAGLWLYEPEIALPERRGGVADRGIAPEDEWRPDQRKSLVEYFEGLLPDYPGAVAVPVGENLVASGVPMKLAVGSTQDAPNAVLTFYEKVFVGRGLNPSWRKLADGMQMVSAVDGERGRVLAIAAARTGDVTEYRVSVADVEEGQFTFAPPTDLPLVPGSGGFFVTEAREHGRRSRSVQSVNWATVDENVEFYVRHLEQRGWLRGEDLPRPEPSKGRTLQFRKLHGSGEAEMLVALEPLSTEMGTTVFINEFRPESGAEGTP